MRLIVLAGLPGTGKSTLAAALAPRLDGIILNKDTVRAALFPTELVEYSSSQDDFVVGLMLETAFYLLMKNPRRAVLLDGRTYRQKYQLTAVRMFCERRQIRCDVIECVCPREVALARLAADEAAGSHPARNRNRELYEQQAASWEGIDGPKFAADTSGGIEECTSRCLAWLAGL
ncbi:MAG: ATP-binding protein [Bryobacterales bacterium]|nr:ATP-binding protein [Bryobacterales bacterium]